MAQAAPAASVVPQSFAWVKGPVATIAEMASVAVPLFVSVTVCAALVVPWSWLPKVSDESDTAAFGTNGTVPVPLKAMVCGLPDTLSEIVSVPVNAPALEGAKETETVQLAAAASAPPQLFVWVKDALAAIAEMVSVPVPLFVNVTVFAVLVVPWSWLPKFSDDGATSTIGTAIAATCPARLVRVM
jgi:hypothetical protein